MSYRFIISGGGTGGHIFPAIAIANELKLRVPNCKILFVYHQGMRTSELELLLNMIEADEEEVSVENEDSLTTKKFELSIQDTELNTENAATEIPKSKIINNNPSQDIEEKDEIDLSMNCKLCQKKFSCKAKVTY